MKTLVLKHRGHEAHVPYELPDSLRFDCFHPEHGMCVAHVDLRQEEIWVTEVCRVDDDRKEESLGWSICSHPVILEQAGDVCSVFDWENGTGHDDAKVLSTIAEMELLESDLHTAWSRLPFEVADIKLAPTQVPTEWAAAKCLERFIREVLVPRAQDLATAAAKRREMEWVQEMSHQDWQAARSAELDLAIDLEKERA